MSLRVTAVHLWTVLVEISELLRQRRQLHFSLQVPQRSAVDLHTVDGVRAQSPCLLERALALLTIKQSRV